MRNIAGIATTWKAAQVGADSSSITMGYVIAGLFFLRFWARTRDSLFVTFAFAFWLLALNQLLVALSGTPREEQSWIYLLRLVAFVLIIVAIQIASIGLLAELISARFARETVYAFKEYDVHGERTPRRHARSPGA